MTIKPKPKEVVKEDEPEFDDWENAIDDIADKIGSKTNDTTIV